METKLFEIRDKATFIPVMAVKLNSKTEQERYLLARAGFGKSYYDQAQYVTLIKIVTNQCEYDIHGWGENRTMFTAHKHINENWEGLDSGDVIDVEFVLGETSKPKISERITA